MLSFIKNNVQNTVETEYGMDIQVGDIVKLKKVHPCGSKEWEVLRAGMDFRIKCQGCEHQVMLSRKQLEKNIRQVIPGNRGENKVEQ